MTSLFYLNQQNMKQHTQVLKINAVLLYCFNLRIKKKTEGYVADVQLIRKDRKFTTQVYSKLSFNGVY